MMNIVTEILLLWVNLIHAEKFLNAVVIIITTIIVSLSTDYGDHCYIMMIFDNSIVTKCEQGWF